MKLVFKILSSDPKDKTIQFTTFQKHYPAINVATHFSKLEPFIRQTTEQWIIPLIGEALYDSIATKYINGDALSAIEEPFLEKIQDAVAYLSVLQALPFINMTISEMGAQENTASQGSGQPVSQWRFKNALWAAKIQGHKALDLMLSYMESKKSDTYFAAWASSDTYKEQKTAFFKSTDQLSKYLNIQNSRTSYLAFLPSIRKAEQQHIQSVIGKELFDGMSVKVASGASLNAFETELVYHIERTTAEWSLVLGAAHLTLVIDGDGFKVIGSSDGFDDRKNSMLNVEGIAKLQRQAENDGNTFKGDLIAFMYKNAEEFPMFKTSTAYKPASANQNVLHCGHTGGIFI